MVSRGRMKSVLEPMTESQRDARDVRARVARGENDARIDERLIRDFLDGKSDAFMHLVQRHQERIRNLIYSILGYTHVVDDLAQDIFIKVYQSLPNFRYQSSFATWLYRVTVNRCRDEIRRNRVRRIFRFDALPEWEHPVDSESTERTERVLINEALNTALQQLSESHRTVILLKEIEGLSYEEIAKVLHCGVGTVKSRLARARIRLKKLLQPYVEEEV
jgi:RNA polymerase sigma-70 factor (ECF subfamily)